MFKGGIPIGKIFGITLRLHSSWFFIFALITWTLAGVYFPATYPEWPMVLKIGAGILTSLLYFVSILIHELCHSLVAIREGNKIQAITLFFLGGVSEMTGEPKTAKDEFRMAVAGPLSSLVLGGIFLGLHLVLTGTELVPAQFVSAVSYYIGYINIYLGVFNLIPGFPLDGGRVLRSIIWWRSGDLQKATRIASSVGKAVGYLFILGGILLVFANNLFNGIWLSFIGWFLISAAGSSYSQMLILDILKGHTAKEIMLQECTEVSPNMSLEQFVNEIVLNANRRCFPVIADNHTEGLITLSDVKQIPRDDWSITPVRQVMTAIDKVKTVSPEEELNKVMQLLAENDINQVPVMQDGNIVGIVARDSIINFIHAKTLLKK